MFLALARGSSKTLLLFINDIRYAFAGLLCSIIVLTMHSLFGFVHENGIFYVL